MRIILKTLDDDVPYEDYSKDFRRWPYQDYSKDFRRWSYLM